MSQSLNDHILFGKTLGKDKAGKSEHYKVEFFSYLGKFAKEIEKLSFTDTPNYQRLKAYLTACTMKYNLI